MASETSAKPAASKRPMRKRLIASLVVLALFGIFLVWTFIRGTWTDKEPRDPTTPADGVVCQLLRTPDGHTPVRCAVVIERPIDEVWALVTDYDNYDKIFPTLASAPVQAKRADGVVQLSGIASSVLGDWPFDVRIVQETTPEKRIASWNASDHEIPVNRGSFEVSERGMGRTLLVYSLEIELASYPNFIVRNVLLSRQPRVVQALLDRLKK